MTEARIPDLSLWRRTIHTTHWTEGNGEKTTRHKQARHTAHAPTRMASCSCGGAEHEASTQVSSLWFYTGHGVVRSSAVRRAPPRDAKDTDHRSQSPPPTPPTRNNRHCATTCVQPTTKGGTVHGARRMQARICPGSERTASTTRRYTKAKSSMNARVQNARRRPSTTHKY